MVSKDGRVPGQELVRNRMRRAWNALTNTISTAGNFPWNRRQLAQKGEAPVTLGESIDELREMCGYASVIDADGMKRLYTQGDIARRIIEIFPTETWKDRPEVYETEDPDETEFEMAWQKISQRLHLNAIMERADILSGIGRFGVLLLGFDDVDDMAEEVDGVAEAEIAQMAGEDDESEAATTAGTTDTPRRLVFVRALDESLVKISSYEEDIKSPRFGQPLTYDLTLHDPETGAAPDASDASTTKTVHWTRVIHLADNRTTSEVFGTPRLEPVNDRLHDTRKIMGGSAEMFWQGGYPGLSIEAAPGAEGQPLDFDDDDLEELRDEIEEYRKGMKRHILLLGLKANSLAPQVADPTAHFEMQVRVACATYAIPWRILLGSEEARLAASQDAKAWNNRIARRQNEYVSPYILIPLVWRLIHAGVLPRPAELLIHWPDPNALTEEEQANIAKIWTEAMAKYVQAGLEGLIEPRSYFVHIIGMDPDLVDKILEATAEHQIVVDAEEAAHREEMAAQGLDPNGLPLPPPPVPGAPPNGKPPGAPAGRPAAAQKRPAPGGRPKTPA